MLIKQIIKGVIMIGSISSAGSMPPPPPSNSEAAITDEQQTALSEILGEHDSENLTEADAQSIVESLSEAGIQPGQAMASAMSELGFDAAVIGDLAGVGPGAGGEEGSMPPPPPPPQQSSEVITSMVDYLAELLEEKLADGTELTDEDKEEIYAQVSERFGLQEGESIINTTA